MAALVLIVGLGFRWCYWHFRGVEVCVTNVDTDPLRSGEVAVTSRRSTRHYRVGDLAQGKTVCVWVKSDGEASVGVTFNMPSGASKVIPLVGYIEPGYSGSISAEVTANGARSVRDHIEIY